MPYHRVHTRNVVFCSHPCGLSSYGLLSYTRVGHTVKCAQCEHCERLINDCCMHCAQKSASSLFSANKTVCVAVENVLNPNRNHNKVSGSGSGWIQHLRIRSNLQNSGSGTPLLFILYLQIYKRVFLNKLIIMMMMMITIQTNPELMLTTVTCLNRLPSTLSVKQTNLGKRLQVHCVAYQPTYYLPVAGVLLFYYIVRRVS